MKTYQAVTEAVLQELREITGAAHVKTAPHILQSYSEDESGMLAHRQAEVVVFPGTAEEISRIMKLANRRRIPVTPRGAGTGVCGGVVPVYGGIVVSMERLNRILEVRENGLYLVRKPVYAQRIYRRRPGQKGCYMPAIRAVRTVVLSGEIWQRMRAAIKRFAMARRGSRCMRWKRYCRPVKLRNSVQY